MSTFSSARSPFSLGRTNKKLAWPRTDGAAAMLAPSHWPALLAVCGRNRSEFVAGLKSNIGVPQREWPKAIDYPLVKQL
jgi:hypothetical protein